MLPFLALQLLKIGQTIEELKTLSTKTGFLDETDDIKGVLAFTYSFCDDMNLSTSLGVLDNMIKNKMVNNHQLEMLAIVLEADLSKKSDVLYAARTNTLL